MSETGGESSDTDQIIRVRLNSMGVEPVKFVAGDVMDLEVDYDDGYVIEVGDRETKLELGEKLHDKADRKSRDGDYKAAQWIQDAARTIERAELEVAPVSSDETVHDEIEVSKHLTVSPFGVDKLATEWEVHTGTEDEYYVTESTARRVEQNLGLDLESDDYRFGGTVIVVADEEADRNV